MSATSDPRQNQFLAALPPADWLRWSRQLERVELTQGEVLKVSGHAMSHVYFPTTAIITMMYLTDSGESAEIAVVGNESLVGIRSLMGGATPYQVVVHGPGGGFRLKLETIQDEFTRQGPASRLLLRHLQAFMTQIEQMVVCNRHHTVDQQLCRWLLMWLDRVQGNELVITHELISNMLGVRREGVTESALKLREAKLIRYAHGHITVLDRSGLEQRSCECYAMVKKECDRLISGGLIEPAHALGACRAWGVDSENRPQREQFLPDLQPHSPAMGQKDGEKWTAAVDSQPTLPKPDRLLGRGTPA